MLYWVSSLLLLAIPPHTHTGKTYFHWSQRPLSNSSFGLPLGEKLLHGIPFIRDKRLRVIAGLKASSQKNGTTCPPRGQPALYSVALLEGGTGRAVCSAQMWHWPQAQLLLPVPVKVPGLDTVEYPTVRGKPQGFSSHSCYTICTMEKGLSR